MRRLILAFLLILIASPCLAGYVDHSSVDVAAIVPVIEFRAGYRGQTGKLLLADGTVWGYGAGGIGRDATHDPPVPIEEIRFWAYEGLTTTSGVVWVWDFTNSIWVEVGQVPIGPISTDQQDVGSMKARYKTQQSNDQE